ncbi:hypothetical protein NIES4071_39650 [Calothrix sp. NIES-4071]|nr:hypothetical protein NIES4071_39650 [Calothrix sp. NIES-4071]BAZ58283.1 hypothetical protein NIES4105_39590 [Calothrix sp. NIES-4105]
MYHLAPNDLLEQETQSVFKQYRSSLRDDLHERVHRVSELIDDFSPLRTLPAFQALEADIQQIIQEQNWCFTDRE